MEAINLRVVKFERRYRGADVTVDWVEVTNRAAIGENGQLSHSTWHRVKDLMPPKLDHAGRVSEGKVMHMEAVWAVIEPAYHAWVKNEEPPETGVPLEQWSGVSADQARVLKRAEIRSVEDVAAIPDDLLHKIALPNLREMRRQAQIWLESRGKNEMARKIADLEAQNAEMLAMLAEKTEPDKPKRGRPRKTEPDPEPEVEPEGDAA